MSNLWCREKRKGAAFYANLFEDIPVEYEQQWTQQLTNEHWKFQFLDYSRPAHKHELTSNTFNDVGNAYFLLKEWRKAMELYSQGLRFATDNLEHMATLYGKRGLCFFNLKMYEKALRDYELALSLEYPLEMAKYLLEYRDNCNKMLSQAATNPIRINRPIVPALSFDADATRPCLANVLQHVKSAELHKSQFIAKTDIEVGKTVLLEDAFTSIAVGFDRTYCFTCLATAQNFIPCPNCIDVMFCSDDCMNRNTVHKMSCGHFYNRMPSYIKLVVQSVLEALASFATVDELMKFVRNTLSRQPADVKASEATKNYATFFSLPRPTNELPLFIAYDAYTTLLTIKFVVFVFNSESKRRFLMHLVWHHVQVLANNSEGGFEKDQNQFIQATMTSIASMFEHSCTPNLLQYSAGNKTALITIQPVRAGDRLTIDFWPDDDDQDVVERRKLLANSFGICCTCEKCSPRPAIMDAKLWEDPSFSFVKSYQEHYSDSTSSLLKKRCADFLQKHKDVEWCKEKDIVIRIYTQCLLDDFQRK